MPDDDIEQRVWEVMHPASACILHWKRASPEQRACIVALITSDHADTLPPRTLVREVRRLLAPGKAERIAKNEADVPIVAAVGAELMFLCTGAQVIADQLKNTPDRRRGSFGAGFGPKISPR